MAQQSLDKSLFEPHLNHRPGYKQTDPSPTPTAAATSSMSSSSSASSAASNDHGTFSVPSSQTSSDDNKGELTVIIFAEKLLQIISIKKISQFYHSNSQNNTDTLGNSVNQINVSFLYQIYM